MGRISSLARPLGELGPIFPRAEKDAIQNVCRNIEEKNAARRQGFRGDHCDSGRSWSDRRGRTKPSPTPEALNAAAHRRLPQLRCLRLPSPIISIDDFTKVELRVAQITVAERIPKADKLLRLEVDLGYETRQILSGIAEHYTPESLIGRKIVIIANLAPRKMRGLESNGMLLAASLGEGDKPVLAGFLEDVPLGGETEVALRVAF